MFFNIIINFVKIKEKKKPAITEKARVTVACAIPKKSKMDDIIDKLTQLGVYRIIPLETERVIVNLDEKKKEYEKVSQAQFKVDFPDFPSEVCEYLPFIVTQYLWFYGRCKKKDSAVK